jgi:hypothetical protein
MPDARRIHTKDVRGSVVLIILGIWLVTTTQVAAETLYAAAGAQGKPSDLLILNPADGSVRCRVGPIGFGVTGLAVHPVTGVLYGTTGNADPVAPGTLLEIDKTTGAGHVIATLPSPMPPTPVTFPDITFTSDGTLYGVLYNGAVTATIDLWSVNVSSLLISRVSTSGFMSTLGPGTIAGGGIAANANNTIYFSGEYTNGPLRTIDRMTGHFSAPVAIMDGNIRFQSLTALAFNSSGTLFGATLLGAARTASLVTIDTTSGHITFLGRSVDGLDAIAFDSEPLTIPLVAAILPGSRSPQVGQAATAFATIINAGGATATSVCIGLKMEGEIPASLSFQTTDPHSNALTGSPNTAVQIPAGQAQTFVIAATPQTAFAPVDVSFDYVGINTVPVDPIVGVNTLLLSGSTTPVPDIVALAATVNNDGIVNIPAGGNGLGFFAVATVNVGSSGQITASADTGSAVLPVSLVICQTNPATSQCLAAPAATVTTQINANDTPTFAIFVQGQGVPVPFDPANNRIFVRFKDGNGVTRGSTSVAVRTQ